MKEIKLAGVAQATGCEFVSVNGNSDCGPGIQQALALAAQDKPVIVDVKIDYSKRTRFTKGIVKTNLGRFTPGNKFRFISRALLRKLTG